MRYIRRTIPEGFTIPDIPEWMSAVLRTRGITSVEEGRRFIRPTLADLHSPFLMPDMEKAVSMIRETIRKGNSITVYGDYDADGVCASSILTEALRDCGARVDYYLPSRHTEGYGLHGEAIRKIAGRAALLITVDCGISNHREIALARELGLRVILSDHHELPEVLPEADAILHPRVGDYPCGHLCGAGVALKLAHALGGDAALDKALDLRDAQGLLQCADYYEKCYMHTVVFLFFGRGHDLYTHIVVDGRRGDSGIGLPFRRKRRKILCHQCEDLVHIEPEVRDIVVSGERILFHESPPPVEFSCDKSYIVHHLHPFVILFHLILQLYSDKNMKKTAQEPLTL